MTVGAAWIRSGADADELWLATDSRLSGDGYIWDDCPKLLPLPRRDAVAGFSGSTGQAYPLLLQTANAISAYRPAQDGTLELFRMVGHLERVVNSMMGRLRIDPAIQGVDPGRREFASGGDALILGGYSRGWGKMAIRALQYDANLQAWRFSRVRATPSLGSGRVIRIFGDARSRGRFRYHLKSLLEQRGTLRRSQAFDLEPLQVLAAMLRMPASAAQRLPLDRRPATIGGAPQVVRVLAGAQATPLVVRWRNGVAPADYLLGRPSFSYERLDLPLVDFLGDTVQILAPSQWQPFEEDPDPA